MRARKLANARSVHTRVPVTDPNLLSFRTDCISYQFVGMLVHFDEVAFDFLVKVDRALDDPINVFSSRAFFLEQPIVVTASLAVKLHFLKRVDNVLLLFFGNVAAVGECAHERVVHVDCIPDLAGRVAVVLVVVHLDELGPHAFDFDALNPHIFEVFERFEGVEV